MKAFLEYVAEDIITKCGTDLSHTAVVFPNKRASLFMNEHLARLADKPLWSPTYITISDLFRRHSNLKVADQIKLICDLHKCFIKETDTQETLDHFYGWGQLLLADFDDIDKNMADARQVFANVRDLHELDDISFLNEEQEEALRKFFSNFTKESASELKRRFLSLWTHLYDVYASFNKRVREQGLAYEGALYREVVTNADVTFPFDRYIFVGFNVLQEVEQRLFTRLKDEGKAMFYWDYDYYYMPRGNHGMHEAGHYISQYRSRFPNELDDNDARIYDNFRRKKTITYVSATTEDIQARYTATWLNGLDASLWHGGKPDTAVVMCNERLLPSVVHSIPEGIAQVNITTGYPLHDSPYAVDLLAGLKKKKSPLAFIEWGEGYLTDAAEMLKDPDGKLDEADRQMRAEAIYRMFTLLQRLEGLIKSGDLDVTTDTIGRLLRQLLRTTSVPFHGEPAVGLQVMGVLETRNIDFKNILILSCNEGNMPKGINDTSFIPYNVRKAHGLTTVDNKVAVYAYYFHRMLQRAENVTIVYNSSTDDGHKGEMSRFMLQMMVENNHAIEHRFLKNDISIVDNLKEEKAVNKANADDAFNKDKDLKEEKACDADEMPPMAKEKTHEALVIAKTPQMMEMLYKRFGIEGFSSYGSRLLSPTPINNYMRCPVSFYYRFVVGLKEADEIEEGQMDARIFGNLFHESAKNLYEQYIINDGVVSKKAIDDVLKTSAAIERVVDEEFNKQLEAEPPYSGLYLITRNVIITYLKRLLMKDSLIAPFTVVGLEFDIKKKMTIKMDATLTANGKGKPTQLSFWLGGRIDRLDCVDVGGITRLRVVDYKTGSGKMTPLPDVKSIFMPENIAKHSDYYFQTFVYGLIVSQDIERNPNQYPVSPALFFIQHAEADNYDPTLMFDKTKIIDVAVYEEEFMQACNEIIKEIFSANTPFVATDDTTRCKNCPYAQLCNR